MLKPTYPLSAFQFNLPQELLATHPAQRRDHSRLMVCHVKSRHIENRHFYDFPVYFQSGDLLVRNNTRVVPARLLAYKDVYASGALVEVLLLQATGVPGQWLAMIGNARKARKARQLVFSEQGLSATLSESTEPGQFLLQFNTRMDGDALAAELYRLGTIPLPPYIKRQASADDEERYQTVYAKVPGAVAAPTAGLHFTPEIFQELANRGVSTTDVTLKVGAGTFKPVKEEDVTRHIMHAEEYELSEETAQLINGVNRATNKVCAVGTTSLRTLETCATPSGQVEPGRGSTQIFIYPPYTIRSANALLTNFHTPGSTLMMMIASVMGYDFMMQAYAVAVEKKYRFFSYGDAMLILQD